MLPIVKFRTNMPGLLDNYCGKPAVPASWQRSGSPGVNIAENNDGFKIEMAVPGMAKDDFNLTLDQDVLTISYEKKFENDRAQEQYLRKEFGYSSFKRSFGLPETADSEKIKASHLNGVLMVEIPKKEEAKPKPVREIKVS